MQHTGDMYLEDKAYLTPIMIAMQNNHVDIVKFFIEERDYNTSHTTPGL